jgi:hypothetical protein
MNEEIRDRLELVVAMLRDQVHLWLVGPWFGAAWAGAYAFGSQSDGDDLALRRMEEMDPMGGDAAKLPIATNVPKPQPADPMPA